VFAAKYQLKRVTVAVLNFASFHSLCCLINRQEAQLSQRDRATLRVIEYFAKSLTVTQGHWK